MIIPFIVSYDINHIHNIFWLLILISMDKIRHKRGGHHVTNLYTWTCVITRQINAKKEQI